MKDLNLLREKINSNNRAERLRSARELGEAIQKGTLSREMLQEVNNHVHNLPTALTNRRQLHLPLGKRA